MWSRYSYHHFFKDKVGAQIRKVNLLYTDFCSEGFALIVSYQGHKFLS